MARLLLRVAAVVSALVLATTLGCLGGSTPGVTSDTVSDASATVVPPTLFHQTPKSGKVVAYNYESVSFEGLIIPGTAVPDFTPFHATWYDLTQDIDLCRTYAQQGPSCKIWPTGSVSLEYPRVDVPILRPGRHDIEFRVSWGDGGPNERRVDPFWIEVTVPPEEAEGVVLSWSPSGGAEPLSSDTLRLIVDRSNLASTAAEDVISFDVEWFRDPPLDAPRRFENVIACPEDGDTPAACLMPKDDVCVDDEWWTEVTVHNVQGQAATTQSSNHVIIANTDPSCQMANPETDRSVCQIGLVSGEGVRGQYRCRIACDDADNRTGNCDHQSIFYRFEWLQPSVAADPIATSHSQDDDAALLQGRAEEDDTLLGTALHKGELLCNVFVENDDLADSDTTGLQGYTCRAQIQNTEPTLGRSCVSAFNEDFEGLNDQNTRYACEPDMATLVDPDDDVSDPSLFLYRYAWQRIPQGGSARPIAIQNDELPIYPFHCAPGVESNLRRGDTLCCKSVPHNPGPNAEDAQGRGEFGAGEGCCVEIGNTPPQFILPPVVQAVSQGDLTPMSAASELTDVHCDVPDGAFFDCDNDAQRPGHYEWWVELPDGGRYQLHPEGEPDNAVLHPESFNKGDTLCCVAFPYDGFDYGLGQTSASCVPVVNTPPSIDALHVEPISGPKDEDFTCVAQWHDPDAEDNLPGRIEETYTFIIIYSDGQVVEVSDANGDGKLNPSEPPLPLGQGDRIHCCLQLEDDPNAGPGDKRCSDQPQFGANPAFVVDRGATIDGVELAIIDGPEPPTELSTIQCRPYGWWDFEGDPEGYRFRWYVNETLVKQDPASGQGQAVLTSTLDGAWFDKGDIVTCKVITFDGTTPSGDFQEGAADSGVQWSNSVEIADACWTVEGIELDRTEGHNDHDTVFHCRQRGFQDPDQADIVNPQPFTFRWYQTPDPQAALGNPILGPGGLPVATDSITGDLLVPNTNDRLVCALVHSCAEDPNEQIVSANSAGILNFCPSLGGVTLTFSNDNPEDYPLVGDVVSCTPDGWNDAESAPERYRFEWRVAGETLPNETDQTLTLTPAMAHQPLSCGAAPIDDFNEDCTLYLAPAMPIDNSPPTLDAVHLLPPILYTNSDVVCAPDGWADADGDSEGYTFSWLIDGLEASPIHVNTTRYNGDTLSSEAFQKGQRVVCRAIPTDRLDSGATVQSDPVIVLNTLPSIEVSFEEPAPNPERGESLRCRFDAEDADGDNVVGTFHWYRNGELQNLTGSADLDHDPAVFELSLDSFHPCDRFTCEVVPSDGDQSGLARSAEAQYWGGAAMSLTNMNAVVHTPVDDLLPAEGTVDFWFRLASGVSNTERVLFAHNPSGAPSDRILVVLAADGSPAIRLGETQIAKLPTIVPVAQWTYYALQWSGGSWDLLVYILAPDGDRGQWYKIAKSGVSVDSFDSAGLYFGAGDATQAAPVGILDEIRFSRTRRWDPAVVPFDGGVPQIAPSRFWMPLQGDPNTLALYHITTEAWPEDGETPPLTDWTPAADSPATYSECQWTRLSLTNECVNLVNVPPPAPVVALKIDGIRTIPAIPDRPNYPMLYSLGCDIVEPSVDFNGDEVGYIFHLFVDGLEAEQQFVAADEVRQGTTGVTFVDEVTLGPGSTCPTVTCAVEAFDGEVYSRSGEDAKILGYANYEDWDGVLNRSFEGLGFGCATDNVCLTNACIDERGGCVFDPKQGMCNDGDACTGSDTCQNGRCVGSDICEDGNQCRSHTCQDIDGVGVCEYENLTGTCSDGNACTVNDTCIDGFCVPGYQQNCDDGRDCTADSCDESSGCDHDVTALDGALCDNANQCTTNSTCRGGNCVGGDPIAYDDGNQCTIDGCNPDTGVYHSPRIGEVCSLSDPCVANERCQLVGVTAACVGEEKSCDDGNTCTTDGCDPSIPEGCYHLPNSDTCNDLDPCTLHDFCSGGTCQPGTTQLTCNDGNACTTDLCEYGVGCRFVYNTDACNDGNACTQEDHCQVGVCTGTPISCDDNNPCTLDYCDSVQGCVYLNTTNACNDNNECTTNDSCQDGVCSGTAISCDDHNPCTTDTCDGNVGCVYTNNNDACDDGNPCSLGDHCVDGFCLSGVPKDCDDVNVCTFDTCNAVGDCEHIAQPGSCEDVDPATLAPNLCTLEDYCQGGVCQSGTMKNCDDNEFCTVDSCDTTSGLCVYENRPENTACTDGDACTEGDLCLVPAGSTDGLMACTPGAPKDCDDGNVCTTDSCDLSGACVHRNQEGITCDDGNACTTADQCIAGTCTGTSELACDDSNSCTTDSCAPDTGCMNTPRQVDASCNDANPCTVNDVCMQDGATLRCVGATKSCDDANSCTADYCDTDGVCRHTNLTGSCDDGNACTTGDTCQSGLCSGGSTVQCADGNSCTTDSCDTAAPSGTDPCVHIDHTLGTMCSDGDPCTLTDRCVEGPGSTVVCEGEANSCDDSNVCTDDVCLTDGTCAHTLLSGSACNDNNACTTADTCSNGVCVGGDPPSCDDANSCTVDSCEPASGCVYTPRDVGTFCDDNDACTSTDRCQLDGGGAILCRGQAIGCDDGNPCTADACYPATGCANTPAFNNNPCDDGDACTANTTCSDGVCGGGTTTTCDDGNECTADSCNSADGSCVYANRQNGLTCDDGDPCRVGDRCVSGLCTAATNAPNGTTCDDEDLCTPTDTCQSGTCTGTGQLDCDDDETCTQDSCDPLTGCFHSNLPDNQACDDGDACTSAESCTSGVCTGGSVVDCDDNNDCTEDSCLPASGCLNADLSAGTTCSDGDACTDGDSCDGAGTCLSGVEICDVCVSEGIFACDGSTDMSVSGTSDSGPTDIDVYTGGTCSATTYAGREATYSIQTTAGSDVEAFWTNATGGPLTAGYGIRILHDDEGCNPNACVDDSTTSVVSAATTAGDSYFTVLDHTSANTGGQYLVHVRCTSGLACTSTLECDDASLCNMTSQTNEFGQGTSRYDSQNCTGGVARDFAGRDRVFTFQATQSGQVAAFITDGPGAPDYFMFVLSAGINGDCDSPDPRNCVASSFNTSTSDANTSVGWTASASEVFCIVVDSNDAGLTEPFTFSVGCF